MRFLLSISFVGLSMVRVHGSARQREHAAAHALFPIESATHFATRSGDWNDRNTWDGHRVPDARACVHIPEEVEVRIETEVAVPLSWIRVDGSLRFATDTSTGVRAVSLFVGENGLLTIGTRENRVTSNVTACVRFLDRGRRDRVSDPTDLSGGLIAMGKVVIAGEDKTAYAFPATPVRRGDSSIRLAASAENWRVGDRLLFPGLSADRNEDEERSIARLTGLRIELDRPLAHDHVPPADAKVPVGNLTRNVRFASEVAHPAERRAHVIFLHRQTGVAIEGAAFRDLGRTRADRVHTRPTLDASGKPLPGTDANTVGRYALHFHACTGADRRVPPHVVRNCVIVGSPKHGLVNHGGHVLAENNVTYRIAGSHFFGENGSEVGVFAGNLAVRSTGSGEDMKSRMYSFDLGHTGHGFWMHGGGIVVRDCHAFGHRSAAFIYHMKPCMIEEGRHVRFAAHNLEEPRLAEGEASIPPAHVPIRFSGNRAAASERGVSVRYHGREAAHGASSVLEDSTFWNIRDSAIDLEYSSNVLLRRIRARGEANGFSGTGMMVNSMTCGVRCEDVRLTGFETGVVMPQRGSNAFVGGMLENQRNIFIQAASESGRRIAIENAQFGARGRHDVFLVSRAEAEYASGLPVRWNPLSKANLALAFEPDTVLIDGRQLFYHCQARSAVPFRESGVAAIDGRSNIELWRRHRIAVGGVPASKDAMPLPRIRGLVGSVTDSGDRLRLTSPRWTNLLDAHVASAVGGEGRIVQSAPRDLVEGWNVVSFDVNGEKRGLLVCGDTEPPGSFRRIALRRQ